jgi:hypothetical protein
LFTAKGLPVVFESRKPTDVPVTMVSAEQIGPGVLVVGNEQEVTEEQRAVVVTPSQKLKRVTSAKVAEM